jgi:hypothetical protein
MAANRKLLIKMVSAVGLEPHPEIPTAETIVLKIVKNTRKTSVDAGFEGVFDLSLKAGKTCQVGGRQYKSSTFFGHENSLPSSQPIPPICASHSFVVPPKEASKADGSVLSRLLLGSLHLRPPRSLCCGNFLSSGG